MSNKVFCNECKFKEVKDRYRGDPGHDGSVIHNKCDKCKFNYTSKFEAKE